MILFTLIIFVLSFLTLSGMFLVKLGQAGQRPVLRVKMTPPAHHDNLTLYFKRKFSVIGQHLWHFILEAKDLKPAVTSKTIHDQYDKVKSAFRIRVRTSEQDPQWLPEATALSVAAVTHTPEEGYLEAIKRNPTDRQAYEALGRLYLQNKNYQEASEIFEYLTKLDPTRDVYFSNLGLCYYSQKDFAKGATAYEKALALNSKIPTRWVNLALCFEALDQANKAVKALTQALNLDKLNIHYMMMLADAYVRIENVVRAEEVLEQILVQDPTNRAAREKLMKLRVSEATPVVEGTEPPVE
jgi:tetratricopeptide (TPR) repeat protein